MSNFLFFLLVLACPVAMWLMMRGGHGHGAEAHSHSHGPASIDDLRERRERRDDLDQEIAARERQ